MVCRTNEGYRALESVLSNRVLEIKAKKCLYEGVIVPTALYGAEAYGMRSAERRKVNVLVLKCEKFGYEYHEWIDLFMKRCV